MPTYQSIYPYTHTRLYLPVYLPAHTHTPISTQPPIQLLINLPTHPHTHTQPSPPLPLSTTHRVVDPLPRGVGVGVLVAGDVASRDGLVDVEDEADHHLDHHRYEEVAVDSSSVVLQAPAGRKEGSGRQRVWCADLWVGWL